MNDRELLELAAKAAGIAASKSAKSDLGILLDEPPPHTYVIWNPLEDDGDALRLAVKLRMWVNIGAGWCRAATEGPEDTSGAFVADEDTNAATRRAIVRAAAEIGKAMP